MKFPPKPPAVSIAGHEVLLYESRRLRRCHGPILDGQKARRLFAEISQTLKQDGWEQEGPYRGDKREVKVFFHLERPFGLTLEIRSTPLLTTTCN